MARLPDLWRDFDRPFASVGSWRPLLRQLDDFMNDMVSGSSIFGETTQSQVAAIDVEDSGDHYVLSFDMPGLERDQISVELHGNQLVVSGERKQEETSGEGGSRFKQRRYRKFERSITIPQAVKIEQVEAQYHNGVLMVALPKSPEAKSHKIQIGEGASGGFLSKFLSGSKKTKEKETIGVQSSNKSQSQPQQGQSATAH